MPLKAGGGGGECSKSTTRDNTVLLPFILQVVSFLFSTQDISFCCSSKNELNFSCLVMKNCTYSLYKIFLLYNHLGEPAKCIDAAKKML